MGKFKIGIIITSRNSTITMVDKRGDALKIVVLGEARVGKTSISLRFVNNTFNKEQMSTVDASFLDKKVTVGERTVKLNIWDTAG